MARISTMNITQRAIDAMLRQRGQGQRYPAADIHRPQGAYTLGRSGIRHESAGG